MKSTALIFVVSLIGAIAGTQTALRTLQAVVEATTE